MFTVEVVTVIMLVVTLLSLFTPEYGTFGYNLCVFLILFVTLLFANFAEAIAEARGKAQADSLRKTREETPAKLVIGDKVQTVSSSKLKKGMFLFVKPVIRSLPMERLLKDWLPLTKVPLPVNLLR